MREQVGIESEARTHCTGLSAAVPARDNPRHKPKRNPGISDDSDEIRGLEVARLGVGDPPFNRVSLMQV